MKVLPSEAIQSRPVIALPVAPPAPASAPRSGVSFGEVVARLGKRIDASEEAVNRAASAREVSTDPASLLKLQAQVYRYVEAVDLASKLVDRATSAVKTTLQGQ